MLVLTRKVNESIILKVNNEIVRIKVIGKHGWNTQIGIDAPNHIIVDREEVYERKLKEKGTKNDKIGIKRKYFGQRGRNSLDRVKL